MSIAWIPKGVLDRIRQICFSFLWQGKKEEYSRSWVKWEKIATPKAMEGHGLKNVHIFSTALAEKFGWRLLSTTSLWTEVITKKYIALDSLIEWVRRPQKSHKGGSIFWKAILKSLHLIEDHLAWKVGNGHSVEIALDPWPGSGQQHILPQEIKECLADWGLLHLHKVADPGHSSIWQ